MRIDVYIESIINYETNECYVTVAQYAYIIPEANKEEFKHIALSHDWKPSW